MTASSRSTLVAVGDLTAPSSRVRRAARWLAAPLKPFLVALFPDRIRPEVVAGRYGAPLLAVIMCACVAAFALGTRMDVAPMVHQMNAGQAPTANAPEIKTDREIDEEIAKMTAMIRVKVGLEAALQTPLRILLLGLALLLLARYIGGMPTASRTLTVAALAAVPGAVRSLITAIVAWQRPRVFPDELDSLVTFPQVIPDGHPVLARLFGSVDVFTWWSVVIIVIGMCAAADIKLRKSIVAVGISFALYLVVTGIIMGGGR